MDHHSSHAIAATLASIILFTSLLVANGIIYNAVNERLRLSALSSLEQSEVSSGRLMMALAAYSSLGNVQGYLAANPGRCTEWRQYAASLGSSVNSSESRGRVFYTVSAVSAYVEEGLASQDNMTLLKPFSGFDSDALNLKVIIHLHGFSSPELPSYARDEIHFMHLPVSLKKMLSLCLASLSDLSRVVVASKKDCSSGLALALNGVRTRYISLAQRNALGFALDAWVVGGKTCSRVDYAIRVTQDSVPGVSGIFAWSVYELGSLEL